MADVIATRPPCQKHFKITVNLFLGSDVHPRDAALCRVPEQPRPASGQRRRVRHVRRGGAGDHVTALRLVRVLAGNL